MPTTYPSEQIYQDAQIAALVHGMQTRRLYQVSTDLLQSDGNQISSDAIAVAQQAQAACLQITKETINVQKRLVSQFMAAGIKARRPFVLTEASGLEYHEFSVEIRADHLGKALRVASDEGFAVDEVLLRKWKAASREPRVFACVFDGLGLCINADGVAMEARQTRHSAKVGTRGGGLCLGPDSTNTVARLLSGETGSAAHRKVIRAKNRRPFGAEIRLV